MRLPGLAAVRSFTLNQLDRLVTSAIRLGEPKAKPPSGSATKDPFSRLGALSPAANAAAQLGREGQALLQGVQSSASLLPFLVWRSRVCILLTQHWPNRAGDPDGYAQSSGQLFRKNARGAAFDEGHKILWLLSQVIDIKPAPTSPGPPAEEE